MVLLIYDIANNKRRRKVVRILESYGNRVQESAFEMDINPRQEKDMIRKVTRVANKKEDNIRVYHLNKNTKLTTIGIDLGVPTPQHIII